MNLLTQHAPREVEIAGVRWPIRTDFRVSIRLEQRIAHRAMTDGELIDAALALYYEKEPPDRRAAANAALWFYRCGEERDAARAAAPGHAARVYDWEQDAGPIYAAFLADYGIDLEAVEYLHWWKFRALFAALRPDNAICRIMEYRSADLGELKGKQRKHYERMQRIYALRPSKEARQRRSAIAQALQAGGRLSL